MVAAKTLIVLILCGCAVPSKTQDFCYPRLKYDREKKEISVGVKCHHR